MSRRRLRGSRPSPWAHPSSGGQAIRARRDRKRAPVGSPRPSARREALGRGSCRGSSTAPWRQATLGEGDRGRLAMPATTRDRTDDLHALEELWTAPAYGERAAQSRRVPLVPGALVAGGWVAFFGVAMAFQPQPEPGMTWPVWATAVSVVQIMLLLGAAAIGPALLQVRLRRRRVGGPARNRPRGQLPCCRASSRELVAGGAGSGDRPHGARGRRARAATTPLAGGVRAGARRSGRRSAPRPCAGCR